MTRFNFYTVLRRTAIVWTTSTKLLRVAVSNGCPTIEMTQSK